MMKLKRVIFYGMLLLTASTCRAGLYPVVVGFNSILTPSTGVFPYVSSLMGVTWGLREVGPNSETPIIAPTYVGVVTRSFRKGGDPTSDQIITMAYSKIAVDKPGRSVGDYAREMYAKGMLPKNLTFNNMMPCLGVGAGMHHSLWATVQMPTGTCYELPPGEQWCDTDQSDLKIDFATLNMSSGLHQKSEAFHFRCTGAMKMRLEFIDNNFDLSNGMTSKMDVVESGDGWINGSAGDNLVHIRSTINTDTATKAGPFSGSTILVIKYF